MGLLDKPKDTLNPDIWDLPSMKLNSDLKKELLSRVTNIISFDSITNMYIIGSTTGYKWSDTSDIDVNIEISNAYITGALQKIRKKVNGKLYANTKHAINYFITPEEIPRVWKNSYYGVYDVLNNIWIASPGLRKNIKDPQKEFWFELILAKQELRYFKTVIKRWKKYKVQGNKELTKKYFNEAKRISQKLDSDRKLDYDYSWGIPRKNWENIIYKLFEHSDVGPEFEYLKEIKD